MNILETRTQLVPLVIFIIILSIFIFSITDCLYKIILITEHNKNYKNYYISDEIYYVSSARTTLYKIFNVINIKTNDPGYYYTIFFESKKPSYNDLLNYTAICSVSIIDYSYKETSQINITVSANNETSIFTKYIGGANAIYVKVTNNSSILCLKDLLVNNGYNISDIIPGWAYPDVYGINNYFNLEHPPLGKYFIALSILILGDYPLAWRIPSSISVLIVFILSYFITVKVLNEIIGHKYSYWIALLAPIIMFFDNAYRTVGLLAMLDPYVSLFTVIGLYFFVQYEYTDIKGSFLRTISFVLAGLVKFSGLFIVLADFIEGFFIEGTKLFRIRQAFLALMRYYIVFPVMLILFSLPLISYLGFNNWYKQAIIDAFKWHLRTKHPTGYGPVTSSPIDWLLGTNAFPLWYNPSLNDYVRCQGIPPIYLISLILSIIIIINYKRYVGARKTVFSLYSILLFYTILYIIGNKTLYSFYIIQLSPLFVITFISSLTILSQVILNKLKK